MLEKIIDVPARDGKIDTFMCHPERRGPWPGVIFYMDAPGIREELFDLVRRLAATGYCVFLPNLYHRRGRGQMLNSEANNADSPEHVKMFELMHSLSNGLVAEDTEALLAFIDAQPEPKKGLLGCVGYCMGGPFAMTAAARFPERFAAAVSLHGVPFVTQKPDSAHLHLASVQAETYFGFGSADVLTPQNDIDTLRAELEKTRLRYEIEMYAGCSHGFVFPQRASYNKQAAERHWERLLVIYRSTLG
jgi:carboxymethylenebutenolidase